MSDKPNMSQLVRNGVEEREDVFVEAYFKSNFNASEAARKAFPENKWSASRVTRLLRRANIALKIEQKHSELQAKQGVILSAEQVLAQVSDMAKKELLCPRCAGRFSSQESTKLKALELLGKYWAVWVERIKAEHTVEVREVDSLSNQELERLAQWQIGTN